MVTRKKLQRQRDEAADQKAEEATELPDPSGRPRWRRHTKAMEAMLKGVDPDRFERLADGTE